MADRLFGIETEYGLTTAGIVDGGAARDRVVGQLLRHVRDMVPSVNDGFRGLFAQNGSRFYIDCGHHPEWTTPEVVNPWDSVRYVLAADRLLAAAADRVALDGDGARPLLLKSNVCYESVTSWGCHESVMHRTEPTILQRELTPLLVSRVIVTGAGGFSPFSPGIAFVLSPRATFIEHEASSESTNNRAIFHTKNETLCRSGHNRLHVICGESLCSELAAWLRGATLVMAVAMAEAGIEIGARMALRDPVSALRALIADPSCRLAVETREGQTRTALEIQRAYLAQAEAHANADFMPPWAEAACRYWRETLDRIALDPETLCGTLDWAIKRRLFGQRLAHRGFDWASAAAWTRALEGRWRDLGVDPSPSRSGTAPPDMAFVEHLYAEVASALEAAGLPSRRLGEFLTLRRELFEMDLRFGQLAESSLFASLDRAGVLAHHVPGVDNIEHAMEFPPDRGRARVRGAVIRRVQANREAFLASWDSVRDQSTHAVLDLSDPLEAEEKWSVAQEPPTRAGRDAAGTRGRGDPPSPLARRIAALNCTVRGDYATAERLLRELLEENFETPGTLVHLARVLLLAAQADQARTCTGLAWAIRGEAPAYVVGRAIWLLAVFECLERRDMLPWLGRLKWLLRHRDAVMDWTMTPVLERLRGAVPAEELGLLGRLTRVMSGACLPDDLDEFELWRAADEVVVE